MLGRKQSRVHAARLSGEMQRPRISYKCTVSSNTMTRIGRVDGQRSAAIEVMMICRWRRRQKPKSRVLASTLSSTLAALASLAPGRQALALASKPQLHPSISSSDRDLAAGRNANPAAHSLELFDCARSNVHLPPHRMGPQAWRGRPTNVPHRILQQ